MQAIIADGDGDLIEAFRNVPIEVICTLIGVPHDEIPAFVKYGAALSPVFGLMEPEQIIAAQDAIVGLAADTERMIAARSAERGDDLISVLVDAEEEGDHLTHEEVVTMVGNLIVGGHDTTASQIGCSLLTLLRHRGALDDLRNDRSLASAVVNETIRFEPGITLSPRTIVEPLEIGGIERAAGSMVFLCTSATSRQPDIWGDADVFRPDRFTEPGAPKLLSFGSGPHYCLGAALARMTLEEVVAGAAAAGLGRSIVPTIDIDDPDAIEWISILGRSPATLPVTVAR